jgi:uncharacterized protein (TIGR02246 family)
MSNDTSAGTEVEQVRRVALSWIDAVASADIDGLARLMAEDIVVIHGNGRTVEGRDAVLAGFAQSFSSLTVKQTVEFEETVVAADWAFDRATVHSTICPREGGDPKHFESRTITILRREASQTWCVARSIGVVVQQQSST